MKCPKCNGKVAKTYDMVFDLRSALYVCINCGYEPTIEYVVKVKVA